MSYLVLARKYRPQTFSEMVGQQHVVQALSNALSQQRLHHAWLFTGTRGIGKTTVARILAKSLNCTGPDGRGGMTATPCGQCQACREIDAGNFVDYTELDAASNRGVDEVQALLEQAVYKPVQGRFKVFMIDEVHMLTGTAFNAMLKTLEEPPEYLKFILATTDPQKIPVTVLSRCLQFNLRPMAPEVILEHLQQVLQAEGVAAENDALFMLARAARGSMRDALSLADQAIAYGAGRIEREQVGQMLGLADRSLVHAMIEALSAGDGPALVQHVDALRTAGLSASNLLSDMADVLQRMAVRQAMPQNQQVQAPEDPDAREIMRLSALLPSDETQLLYSLCIHGRAELGLAPDEYVGLNMALLRLLPFQTPRAEKKTTEKTSVQIQADVTPVAAPGLQATTPQPPSQEAQSQPPEKQSTEDQPAKNEPASDEPAKDEPVVAVAENEHLQTESLQTAEKLQDDEMALRAKAPAPVVTSVLQTDAARLPQAQDGCQKALDDFWSQLVQQIQTDDSLTGLARELALQSQLVQRAPDVWHLRVEAEALSREALRQRLQEVLKKQGHAVSLKLQVGAVSDNRAQRHRRAMEQKLQVAEDLLMSDAFVQEMIRDFGARVVPGSIHPL